MCSAQGRFISPDEVFADQHVDQPQSFNLYLYVRNSPLTLIDELGRAAQRATEVTIGPLPDGSRPQRIYDVAVGSAKAIGRGISSAARAIGGDENILDRVDQALMPDNARQVLMGKVVDTAQEVEGGKSLASLGTSIVSNPVKLGKETRIATESFEQARNGAIKVLGDIGSAQRSETIGRQGALKGLVTGFSTRVDGVFKQFRIDFGPSKGAHINVTVGKAKYSFEFQATEEQVKKLLKKNAGK